MVLSVLVVVLLAASVTLAFVVRSHLDARDEVVASRDAALQAGRQAILNLDALSASTIDADLKRVLDGATGQFKAQFQQAQKDLKTLVVSRKTVSQGTILSAGVVRADDASATVLVAVDRLVKDSTTPAGTTAHDRWKVSLERRGGRWLVAVLDAVA
jgi:Mce-associated membrane protein